MGLPLWLWLTQQTSEHIMPSPNAGRLKLCSREPKIRVLHSSWMAVFITFLVWFNYAPPRAAIRDTLAPSKEQVAALGGA